MVEIDTLFQTKTAKKKYTFGAAQTTIEYYPMMHLVSCYIITANVTYHDQ